MKTNLYINFKYSQNQTMSDTKFSNLWFSGQNPNMWPFIAMLLSSTLLWRCLFFNFTQFVILKDLSILDLPQSGVKRLRLGKVVLLLYIS